MEDRVRIELVPVRPVKAARGSLKGIDTDAPGRPIGYERGRLLGVAEVLRRWTQRCRLRKADFQSAASQRRNMCNSRIGISVKAPDRMADR